jgi:hypothetical protein
MRMDRRPYRSLVSSTLVPVAQVTSYVRLAAVQISLLVSSDFPLTSLFHFSSMCDSHGRQHIITDSLFSLGPLSPTPPPPQSRI